MDFFRNTYKDTLRLVRGNDFATIHNIVAKYPDDTEVDGFDLNVCTDLMVRIKRDNGNFKDIETYAERWFIIEPKKIRVNFDGLKMKNGSYRIEFFGKFQGKDWRCYSEDKGFGVVESNEEANIPVETIIADGVYQILTDFTMTYQTQEQADWEETDNTLPSYIKNKPTPVGLKAGYGITLTDETSAVKIDSNIWDPTVEAHSMTVSDAGYVNVIYPQSSACIELHVTTPYRYDGAESYSAKINDDMTWAIPSGAWYDFVKQDFDGTQEWCFKDSGHYFF